MSASNSVVRTPTVKILDPRIDVEKQRQYIITQGANKCSWLPYQSNSTGASSFSFNVTVPSRTTYVDRQMFVKTTITCTFTAPLPVDCTLIVPANAPYGGQKPANNALVWSGYDAPRAYPLAHSLASATLQIGNVNLSMNSADCIDPLLRIMDLKKQRFDNVPSALDNTQLYEEATGTLDDAGNVIGSSNGFNVLANVQNFLANGSLPRGAFNLTVQAPTGVAGGTLSQVVSFDIFENVFLSPLCYDALHSGLVGIANINLQYNFANNSQMVWSGVPKYYLDATGAKQPLNVSMSVAYSATNLWVGFLSSSLQSIPPAINYNYEEVQCFTTRYLTPMTYNGNPTDVYTSNIQLKCVPSRIILGVRPQISKMKYTDTHSYFQIQKASFTFDGAVGLLSSCEANELYRISKKNGLNMDYASWWGEYDNPASTVATPWNAGMHGTGGILVIDPSVDFSLQPGLSSGVSGSYNFQVNLNVKCINNNAVFSAGSANYEIFVIVINDGEIAIDTINGNVSSKIGLVTEADILTAPLDANASYDELKGNGFFSSIKKFAKRAIPLIKDMAPHALEAFKVAKKHLEHSEGEGLGRALIGSGRGGKLSNLNKRSLKDRLN